MCEDYRLLVPLPGEEYEVGVHHQQDIREHQKVVGVPEGIETGKVVQGRRQFHHAPPEGVRCQREGEGHYDDHEDAGDPGYALQQVRVRWLLVVKVGPQGGHELVRWAADQPREVAGDVCERVDRRGDSNRQRHDLVEVDVVVKGYDMAERGGPERRQCVPADG